MTRDDKRHGTYAGYQAHRREGKRPCAACRRAFNDYMREHRQRNGDWREQERARSRAVWALVERHRDEFHQLYVLERMKDREGAA